MASAFDSLPVELVYAIATKVDANGDMACFLSALCQPGPVKDSIQVMGLNSVTCRDTVKLRAVEFSHKLVEVASPIFLRGCWSLLVAIFRGRDLARTARSGTWMIDQHLAPVGRAGKIGGHLLRPSKRRKLLLSQIRVTSTDIDRNDFRQQLELGREESRKDVSHKCLEFGGLRVRIDRLYTLATPPDLDVVRALMTSDQSCHPGPGLSLDYEQSIQMYLARPNLEGGPLDSESELIAVMRNVSIRLTLVCYGCATCREDSYWAEVAVELFFRPEVCGMCFKEEFENAILVDSELDASITRINSFGRTGGQLESLVYNDEDGEGVTWFHPIIKGITDDYYPAGGLFNEALKNGGVLQRLEVFVGGAKVPVATLHGNAVAQGSRAGNLWANNVGEAFFWSSVDVDGELIRVQFGFCNRSDIDSTHIPSMRFLKFIRQNMGP